MSNKPKKVCGDKKQSKKEGKRVLVIDLTSPEPPQKIDIEESTIDCQYSGELYEKLKERPDFRDLVITEVKDLKLPE